MTNLEGTRVNSAYDCPSVNDPKRNYLGAHIRDSVSLLHVRNTLADFGHDPGTFPTKHVRGFRRWIQTRTEVSTSYSNPTLHSYVSMKLTPL